ncbi:uncharacterized protein Z518_05179 [Rhinocladiella mackenziei CBS 650.93]|uniref:Uncharacterized protein n=1 Tax=Rhinocladiella mackenziei CBS 650.93 TaxID=1442369 RepID=A0A0D2FQ28_9EURO|nr:uncharacterized protein Z518_05179 [Rhinocladiella mackenziei CBS 650.93]KIX04312.1 hypothetical protein Z518_05179 [Rhinocladiella mackenziei CBS 650.93]
MKRRAEPASVEDVSDETNNTIPNTRRTATQPNRPTPKRKRTIDVLGRSRTKSATAAIICHSCEPVPLVEAVQKYDGSWPMTILSGGTDRDTVKNEISGYRLRMLFYEDRPISNDTTTFIERDIFMTAEDAEERNPHIWIEQRIFESGKETIKARELFFLERLVDGKVYIFKGCGDQILGVEKLPDLHLTARVLPQEEWPKYLSETAKYYGYDRQIEVHPNRTELKSGKGITYDFNEGEAGPCSGIEVSSKRLPGQSSLGQDLNIFTVKLRGLGTLIEDTGRRSDLNLKICIE